MTIWIAASMHRRRRALAGILAPLAAPKNGHNMPSRAANHHSSQPKGGGLDTNGRVEINERAATPTNIKTNLAVKAWVDMDVVAAAEATTVDTSRWNQCSQGNIEAVGRAAIRTQILPFFWQFKVLSQLQMRIRCWSWRLAMQVLSTMGYKEARNTPIGGCFDESTT